MCIIEPRPQCHEIHARAVIASVSDATNAHNAKIFGFNVAKLLHVDANAKRKEPPKDYLSHIKMAYLEQDSYPRQAYGDS